MNIDGRFVAVEGAIKYVRHGRLRDVGTIECFQSYGISPSEIVQVDRGALSGLRRGPVMPHRWGFDAWVEGTAKNHLQMREIMVSRAAGTGIEFGPGPHAFRIPADANVVYCDFFDPQVQKDRTWPNADDKSMVAIEVKDSLDSIERFADSSLDFVVASHVIEHLRNPVKALKRSYEVLRPGGCLVLVVPDQRYTFDAGRDLTTLEHLIEDYENPSSERDLLHYVDFYKNAAHEADYESVARDTWAKGLDVHFHVWTVTSFYGLVDYARGSSIAPWSEVWWRPKIPADPASNEFYFCLIK